MVVRVLAVVDGGAVTVAANGCGAVAYLLVGVVYAVAIAVDGADAELLSGISGSGGGGCLLGVLTCCTELYPGGCGSRDGGNRRGSSSNNGQDFFKGQFVLLIGGS